MPRGAGRRRLAGLAAAASLLLGAVTWTAVSAPAAAGATSNSYITRSGNQLMVSGHQFRFSGANIFWGGLDSDGRIGYTYPTKFQVQSTLQTVINMGGTVVRCQSCGISTGGPMNVEPSLGKFNQASLQHIDYFIQQAHDYGLRVVIPLTDAFEYYMGSYCDFTDWLKLTAPASCPSKAAAATFYSNAKAISAFEAYIGTLLNHVNHYTGVANKNNPTIMAWELGNEMPYGSGGAAQYTKWVSTIAAYLKANAPHQLVMDGAYSLDPGGQYLMDPGTLKLANVDIQDVHLDPMNNARLDRIAKQVASAGQALVIGEYGWNDPTPSTSLTQFLANIKKNKTITGDMYWDLMPLNDFFGYVEHFDGFQLHFPGDKDDVGVRNNSELPVAAKTSDAPLVAQIRRHAFAMSGRKVPAWAKPWPAVITKVEHAASQTEGNGNLIEWRGSPGASSYVVRRSSAGPNGPWTTVGRVLASATERPWLDAGAGRNVWYQVIAKNPGGKASAPSAPYHFTSQTFEDNMNGFSHALNRLGVWLSGSSVAKFGGDTSRVSFPPGDPTQRITWHVAGARTVEALVYYSAGAEPRVSFWLSNNGKTWSGLDAPNVQVNEVPGKSKGGLICYVYTIDNVQAIRPGANYVRIQRNGHGSGTAELGEVRITHP